MSNEQILRAVRVTVAKPLPDVFFRTNPLNAVVITEMRVMFKITKSLKPEPNKCECTIVNLSETTRNEFAKLPLHLRIDAGYGENLERLFEGDLNWAYSKHVGTEWLTKLESGDGARAFKFAQVNRSFKGGTDAKTLVTEVAKSMGLKMPANIADAKELAKKFTSGVSLTGDSRHAMTGLLKSRGLGWSMQDGRLQILGNEALEGEALVLSEDTGMIEVPDLGAPSKPGALPVLKIKHTLYPGLTPGRKIAPKSRGITGVFRISQVTHTGDTFGDGTAWSTEVEATPL